MSSSEQSGANDRGGDRFSGLGLIIASGVITAAIIGLFAFVVDTREDVVRLETEVKTVKESAAGVASLPVEIGKLQEQMRQVQTTLANITTKLDDDTPHRNR